MSRPEEPSINRLQRCDSIVGGLIPRGAGGRQLEYVVTDAGGLWLPAEDEVILPHMRNTGMWEEDVGRAILDGIPSQSGTFLDIGAHVGYFSCLVAKHYKNCAVYAFEPNPRVYELLALNTWQASDRIVAWPLALASGKGVIPLIETEKNTGDTRCARNGLDRLGEESAHCVAPCIDLDSLLPTLNADVAKIDVQGAEFAVITGMLGVIRRSPKLRIIMEYSPDLLAERSIDGASLLAVLRSNGFVIAVINGTHIIEATDAEIAAFMDTSGKDAHINLLLHRG